MKLIIKYLFLFPTSVIFSIVTEIRNFLYDKGIFKTYTPKISTILIGNLSMGGTGKSPIVKHFANLLIKKGYRVAVLSRGYGRKSKGLIILDKNTKVDKCGDEAADLYSEYPQLIVLVCENREEGIKKIEKDFPHIQFILMDDGFQHRKVNPHLKIILSSQSNLFYQDYVFPFGSLRERRKNIKRADWIIITKCKQHQILETIQNEVRKFTQSPVLFTSIEYGKLVNPFSKLFYEGNLADSSIFLVAAIAKPIPIIEYLQNKAKNIELFLFKDHHNYTKKDIEKIIRLFINSTYKNKLLVTTSKDIVKLKQFDEIHKFDKQVFILPINIRFADNKNEEDIIHQIERLYDRTD